MSTKRETLYFISAKAWLFLASLVLVCISAAVWLFFGRIQTTAVCRGVVAGRDACVFVHQPHTGYITKLYCGPGDYVKKGDKLISVFPCSASDALPSMSDMRKNSIDIASDISGYVAETPVKEWDKVSVDVPAVVMIRSISRSLTRVIAAVPADRAILKHLKPGLTKAVVYSRVRNEDVYGCMTGTVTRADDTAALYEELVEWLGSNAAASYLYGTDVKYAENSGRMAANRMAANAHYLIHIALDTDGATGRTRFSKQQPKRDLIPYEECEITLILEEEKPYQRIFGNGK